MTKQEMIDAVARTGNFTKKDTAEFVAAMTEVVYNTLADGEDITPVAGLKLYVRDVPERTGRNPSTGDPLVIPAHKQVAVKKGVRLRTLFAK